MGDFDILIGIAQDVTWDCQLQMMPLHKRIFWGILGRNIYGKTHKKSYIDK